MKKDRIVIHIDWINSLYSRNLSYSTIGKYIKYGREFLEHCDTVTRKGYVYYKKNNPQVQIDPLAVNAICDILAFIGVGYRRKKKTASSAKPLEKLCVISAKNKELLNEFINWVSDNKDYSKNTLQVYYFSVKKFFEYSNEFNQENIRRFIKTMESEGFKPQTINLRITALEAFSKWMKRPIELNRPKIQRDLDTENIPTEKEYKRLLDYLSGHRNRDYYFFVKILAMTGARVSEFMQFTWEHILSGEVTIRGKGNKYRRFFFHKNLQNEILEYVKKTGKTGIVAVGKCGAMTSRGISANLKTWGMKVGIDSKKMHPHAFRHFFAKMYLKNSGDVIQLSELLGHGSVDTTRIYLQKSRAEQLADFNKNVNW